MDASMTSIKIWLILLILAQLNTVAFAAPLLCLKIFELEATINPAAPVAKLGTRVYRDSVTPSASLYIDISTGLFFRSVDFFPDPLKKFKKIAETPGSAILIRYKSGLTGFWGIQGLSNETLRAAAETLRVAQGGSIEAALQKIKNENSRAVSTSIAALHSELDYVLSTPLDLDTNGALKVGPEGLPNKEEMSVLQNALRLRKADFEHRVFTEIEHDKLEHLAKIHRNTRAVLMSGKNALLEKVKLTEPRSSGVTLSLWDYVRTERFKTGMWWVKSNGDSESPPLAEITGRSTRSPFLKKLGPNASTTVYWFSETTKLKPVLNSIRIRVNKTADGDDHSLEMLAPVGRNIFGRTVFEGFMFRRINDNWVPVAETNATPKNQRCIGCHAQTTTFGRLRLSPIPKFLKTEDDFRTVGYRDEQIIKNYVDGLGR